MPTVHRMHLRALSCASGPPHALLRRPARVDQSASCTPAACSTSWAAVRPDSVQVWQNARTLGNNHEAIRGGLGRAGLAPLLCSWDIRVPDILQAQIDELLHRQRLNICTVAAHVTVDAWHSLPCALWREHIAHPAHAIGLRAGRQTLNSLSFARTRP